MESSIELALGYIKLAKRSICHGQVEVDFPVARILCDSLFETLGRALVILPLCQMVLSPFHE
jgi:hypothetical protein